MKVWMDHLPLQIDKVEAKLCHQYFFDLLQQKQECLISNNESKNNNNYNIPQMFQILANINLSKFTDLSLKTKIIEFAKTIKNKIGENNNQISEIEFLLTDKQKNAIKF